MCGNELQENYEKEFLDFLVQKVNHAGGSLQFQHLSGLLQQLRFEIKDAFGVTKSALMKFLRAHSSTFKINSIGMVMILNSSISNSNYLNEESQNTKTLIPDIKNGEGFVLKIFPDFAIIKARYPINTYVFFTPIAYGADKDSLFPFYLDLLPDNEVCFNAIHGHSDFEIEYRATKVWRVFNSDDEKEQVKGFKGNRITKKKKFTGEGVIKKLFPNVGFISVSGAMSKDVFFYTAIIKNSNIKLRDKVEFVAEYVSEEWQAIEIIKKKDIKQPSDHSERSTVITDKFDAVDENIKNEPGRIYPYSNSKGAVIKFGKNYSKLADGNSCDFYFYGFKVANPDIAMEFSEGDDVKFDAIRSKNPPGWKAILVWAGEKPAIPKVDKKVYEKNYENSKYAKNNDFDSDESASDVLSNNLLSKRHKMKNIKKEVNIVHNKENKFHNKSKVQFDNSTSKNCNTKSDDYHKSNIVDSKMKSQKFFHKEYQSGDKRMYKTKKSNNKHNQEKPFEKTSKNNNFEKYNKPIFKDTELDISEYSESSSEEDNELQLSPNSSGKFLKEYNEDTSEFQNSLGNETDIQSDEETSENYKVLTKSRSSVKKFEAIDGEVIVLYCKFALIKSVHLTKDVDFILNAFYLNGKSVEEQQVIDLKEVIKVGDIIKFNCFEITDDYGEVHQKVTMAWKGPKPDVYEIKPEEFILQHELPVSIGKEVDYECITEESYAISKCTNYNSEFTSVSSIDDNLNTSPDFPMILNSRIDNVEQHLTDVQHERLQDLVLKKLDSYDMISSKSENVFNVIEEIIDLVLKNSDVVEDYFSKENNVPLNDSAIICCSCGETIIEEVSKDETTVDSETQTIISGDIIATSIFIEDSIIVKV